MKYNLICFEKENKIFKKQLFTNEYVESRSNNFLYSILIIRVTSCLFQRISNYLEFLEEHISRKKMCGFQLQIISKYFEQLCISSSLNGHWLFLIIGVKGTLYFSILISIINTKTLNSMIPLIDNIKIIFSIKC